MWWWVGETFKAKIMASQKRKEPTNWTFLTRCILYDTTTCHLPKPLCFQAETTEWRSFIAWPFDKVFFSVFIHEKVPWRPHQGWHQRRAYQFWAQKVIDTCEWTRVSMQKVRIVTEEIFWALFPAKKIEFLQMSLSCEGLRWISRIVWFIICARNSTKRTSLSAFKYVLKSVQFF